MWSGVCLGVDKKTSVMDYVVKTLYDKSEEGLLGVIEDLGFLADHTAPLCSTEVLQDLTSINKQVDSLTQEARRARSLTSGQDIFSSPTAKAISDEYTIRLEEYLQTFQDRQLLLMKRRQLLQKKIYSLMEYFGEDPKDIDSMPIFSALKDFRRALAFSKDSAEWKLYRSQNQA